jgi:hypothetical protein
MTTELKDSEHGRRAAWVTRGFEEFREGVFGNAGQNLYVSRAGSLQRIYQFDLNGNGYLDLVFCNSQAHWEKPDSLVYQDPLGSCVCRGVRSHGARTGTVADLNGDGFDDLVLGFVKDGIALDLNAMVYFGSPEGLTEKYQIALPAPRCMSVAVGDFNGDGKPDIAFLTDGRVRIFYQTELGFEFQNYVDLEITGQQLAADDLDEDGFSDLLVRSQDGQVVVFWGTADGILEKDKSFLPIAPDSETPADEEIDQDWVSSEEFVGDADRLVKTVRLNGKVYIFAAWPHESWLIPMKGHRSFGEPLCFAVREAFSLEVGDVDGDGHLDLVFAARDVSGERECSWVYWGSNDGFDESRRTVLPTRNACDVDLGDLTGDGCSDILIVQNRTKASFTTESLIYRGRGSRDIGDAVRLVSHDARRGYIARTGGDRKPQVILTSNFARSASDKLDNFIYFGSGDGYSAENRQSIAGWGAYTALYADLNDNGNVDLVVANKSEHVPDSDPGSFLWRGGPKGIAYEPDEKLPTQGASGICCADLDGDGYLDLVFGSVGKPEVYIFPGGPNGYDPEKMKTVSIVKDPNLRPLLFAICLVDINGDGWLDLVVGVMQEDHAHILWGGPDGFSIDNSQALATRKPRNITAADLNGNGFPDLIVAAHRPNVVGPHDAFLYVYWNGPEGICESRKSTFPVKSANGLTVADFNNDGLLDIFTGSYSDGRERDLESYIYCNRPGRGFSLFDRECLQTHAVGGCMAADLNEDGWVDLVVTNHKVFGDHKGLSEIWWNGPNGFNTERTTPLPTIGGRGPTLVNPGNLLDRGPEEFYTSKVVDLKRDIEVSGLTWKAEIPAKTWVKGQVRVGSSREALENAPWVGSEGFDSWLEDDGRENGISLKGRWVQFRLALGAVNSVATPRVREVSVHFSAD